MPKRVHSTPCGRPASSRSSERSDAPGERLDDVYVADGNPSEYAALVRAGVVMIASDTAVVAQRAIGDGYRACLK
jgi:hypothetical protein